MTRPMNGQWKVGTNLECPQGFTNLGPVGVLIIQVRMTFSKYRTQTANMWTGLIVPAPIWRKLKIPFLRPWKKKAWPYPMKMPRKGERPKWFDTPMPGIKLQGKARNTASCYSPCRQAAHFQLDMLLRKIRALQQTRKSLSS